MRRAEPREIPVWALDTGWAQLLDLLSRGGVLGVPTESSYGLAVLPAHAPAVESVFRLKDRPAGLPLPVVAAGVEQALALGICACDPGLALVRPLWPAPLTCVVPLRPEARALPAAAGSGSLGVRIPAHPGLRALLLRAGCALTATSANRSGEPPLLDPGAVRAFLATAPFGAPAAVLDGGVLGGGPPSTVVTWRAGQLAVLRRGAFPAERLPTEPPSPQ